MTKNAGVAGSTAWVTKEPNPEGAPFYVKGAVAAKVLGASAVATSDNATSSQLAFALPASGRTVKLYLQAEHTKNAASPLDCVLALVRDMDDEGIVEVDTLNRAWWKAFWLQSYVKLGDDLQNSWYHHLSMVGSWRAAAAPWARQCTRALGTLESGRRHDVV